MAVGGVQYNGSFVGAHSPPAGIESDLAGIAASIDGLKEHDGASDKLLSNAEREAASNHALAVQIRNADGKTGEIMASGVTGPLAGARTDAAAASAAQATAGATIAATPANPLDPIVGRAVRRALRDACDWCCDRVGKKLLFVTVIVVAIIVGGAIAKEVFGSDLDMVYGGLAGLGVGLLLICLFTCGEVCVKKCRATLPCLK
jgi:hypothetical protein